MDEITIATSYHEREAVSLGNDKNDVEPAKGSTVHNPQPSKKKTISKASTAVASPSLSKTSTLRHDENNILVGCKTVSTVEPTAATLPIIPKAERRGLFSRIALVAERMNAKEYSRGTKWFITFVVAAAAAIVTTVRIIRCFVEIRMAITLLMFNCRAKTFSIVSPRNRNATKTKETKRVNQPRN